MFRKLLIANRGEIAIRIMRTAREMGIATVAVYSEADRRSPHVDAADEAVFIGASEPAASYLNIETLIRAAKDCGAEAIHPGYGFLSENPDFAARVAEEGLIFVGPSSEVMRKLGDKMSASAIAEACGVPTVPGHRETGSDSEALLKAAADIGFPLLVKASAGGGGKGMRLVRNHDELPDALALAAGEAQTAFGDGTVFLERYLEKARHVEIQILADTHGNALHLNERECSIQRRHQKIIEETPSVALDPDLRQRMGEAAVALVKGSGYVNAGTVEFLLDESGRFYFLEVNTRLQVEHGVTELVTGLDLVRQQLRIAAGEALEISQADVQPRGHALECRIYAEDPEAGFMPSPGRVLYARAPHGPGLRLDSGIRSGTDVSVHYDPILAKLMVHAENRPAAIARMVEALKNCVVLGVKTPIAYMIDVLQSEPFRQGDTFTRFLEEHFAEWQPRSGDENLFTAAHALVLEMGTGATAGIGDGVAAESGPDPWTRIGRWDLIS